MGVRIRHATAALIEGGIRVAYIAAAATIATIAGAPAGVHVGSRRRPRVGRRCCYERGRKRGHRHERGRWLGVSCWLGVACAS